MFDEPPEANPLEEEVYMSFREIAENDPLVSESLELSRDMGLFEMDQLRCAVIALSQHITYLQKVNN